MTQTDRQQIISDFVRRYHDDRDLSESDAEFESIMTLDRLAYEQPELAWELILEIHALDQSSKVMGMLAAGPLEDVIEYHGPNFIDRIELFARHSPQFRLLLGGVWECSTPEIWARVEVARGKSR